MENKKPWFIHLSIIGMIYLFIKYSYRMLRPPYDFPGWHSISLFFTTFWFVVVLLPFIVVMLVLNYLAGDSTMAHFTMYLIIAVYIYVIGVWGAEKLYYSYPESNKINE